MSSGQPPASRLGGGTVEDETQRPPYSKARNKEESSGILRCILSSSIHVILEDIYRFASSVFVIVKYILKRNSSRYFGSDLTSSILVTPTVNTKEYE